MAERGRPRGFDRDAALERAMRLFWRKTYDGTSLADLTDAMGINAPSLYAAFGSKDALFREAVARYADQDSTGIWCALRDAPDVDAAVEGFLAATAQAYADPDNPPGCLIVLGAQHDADEAHPAHRELRDRRRHNLDELAARLSRAVAAGELPSGFDVAGAAAFLLSVQTGMSILARDGADRAALDAAARGGVLGWRGFRRLDS
ncbi:TetR/AcrR family transcriptional regulator [Sphingomonas sp.]|uniref:TetR/AcrR family transcriptional regulator n=1 Tax=Sphingomonas sp. TaxID=28214 RepID=UPI0031DE2033